MLAGYELTVYHKGFDKNKRVEIWTRYNYGDAWWFGGKGAGLNKGYENANDVNIRLPYNTNNNLEIANFSIGDILVNGNITLDINTQQDLSKYEIYNITSITNNTFGNNPHIHIGGK